jgi:competence protein ComEC
MVWGGAATLLGLIVRPLGHVVAWVAWVFLTYTLEVVRLTARIPRASVPVHVEPWLVWAYYSLLIGLTWWLAQPRERRRGYLDDFRTGLWGRVRDGLSSRLEPKLLVGGAVLLLVLAGVAWQGLPDGRLHVAFLDVGQGDAIFIRTPSGRQVLVDGGPSPSVLLSQLGRHMPFWDRTLDLLILTHPDSDHITGLVAALERYQVDAVVWRDVGCQDAVCQRWRELLAQEGATLYRGEAGLGIALDRGLRIDVLHPGADLLPADGYNDSSIVTRLTYGQASLLLTGDIEARVEERLLADGADLRSTVLKVAHHGACTSSTGGFLEAVAPEVAVISVGADNDFDHPCDEVLERLERVLDERERLFRTDQDGTVEVVSDGARVWMESGRRE